MREIEGSADFQDFFDVRARVHVLEDMAHEALLVDDEGGAQQARLGVPVDDLVLDHLVEAAHLLLGVGEELHRQAVFVAERLVREHVVARDAEDHRVGLHVLALAASADVSSRLVRHRGASWSLEHGPFSPSRFKQLPRRDWTVLIQDANHFSPGADGLLACFDFIPHARIDDVMVSYAAPGGSVGPHVDSYDVFLLQGRGKRRWQISGQKDHSFVPGLDLKILERFAPEAEWLLEPGDILYLPPGVAHHGVAETECLTWSIGFRAPSDPER